MEAAVEIVRVEVAVPPARRVTVIGLNEIEGPAGDAVAESVKVPENDVPDVMVRVTVLLGPPACWNKELGLADIEKG